MKVQINYRDFTYGHAHPLYASVRGLLNSTSFFGDCHEVVNEKTGKKVWVPFTNVIDICEL